MMRRLLILGGILVLITLAYLALQGGYSGASNPSEAILTPVQTVAHAVQTPPALSWKNFVTPDEATLRATLTPLQYDVTQQEGTERAFDNQYWNNEQEGIYVDIVSGEPLFSSTDKFDSGTGWPSFTKPLDSGAVILKDDYLLGIKRTEVRSKLADSHLGHLFDDGPPPLGTRYCMNSAAMRFVPKGRLVVEGYGEYAGLFK